MEESKVSVLDPVDFHGQSLMVVGKDDQPYVAMKPVVEGIGLDWASQFTKLTEDTRRWGTVVIRATVAADGKTREMTCLPLRKLAGWLMTLQPSRMDPEVAGKVFVYQNECDDALWDYWSRGMAVNPRAALTPAEALLASVQQLVDHERRMKAMEEDQAVVKSQVLILAERAASGVSMIKSLPEPVVSVRESTTRARINQVIQGHIFAHGLAASDASLAWRRLYREFKARYKIDLMMRAKNHAKKIGHKVTGLEIAEVLGAMDDLYAVAYELYGVPAK